MEMDFVGAFELEYGWVVDFSRIIVYLCVLNASHLSNINIFDL